MNNYYCVFNRSKNIKISNFWKNQLPTIDQMSCIIHAFGWNSNDILIALCVENYYKWNWNSFTFDDNAISYADEMIYGINCVDCPTYYGFPINYYKKFCEKKCKNVNIIENICTNCSMNVLTEHELEIDGVFDNIFFCN